MSKAKETIIAKVVDKFVNDLDDAKKMYVLGFMEGVQAERAANQSTTTRPLMKQPE